MALFPDWLPWLDKQAAVREAGRMIVASGAATNALIGFAAVGATRSASRARAARSGALARDRAAARDRRRGRPAGQPRPGARAPFPHGRDRASGNVRLRPLRLPAAAEPGPADATRSRRAGTSIPVVVQDPVWERSFPDVSGVTLPLADPDDGTPSLVRLSRREARARRELNEQRAARLDHAAAATSSSTP